MKLKTNKKINAKFNLNYKRDPKDKRDFKFKSTLELPLLEIASTIPTSIDYTSKMGPVKEQGDLGSCVAFAVSAMKEYQERTENLIEIDLGKAGSDKIYDYSEAWIYWNAKKIDEWSGEEGTSIRYAMKVLQKIGVPTEKGWPYRDVGDIGEPKRWANLVARWALIDSYYRVENTDDLRIALANGPVPIGIPCFYEFFFVGSNGIIPYPSNPNVYYGAHAVCAVGYDNSTKLFKFKNSWGTEWGKKGYGYIPYKYVNDFLWDAWAAKDVSVTKDMLKGARELV